MSSQRGWMKWTALVLALSLNLPVNAFAGKSKVEKLEDQMTELDGKIAAKKKDKSKLEEEVRTLESGQALEGLETSLFQSCNLCRETESSKSCSEAVYTKFVGSAPPSATDDSSSSMADQSCSVMFKSALSRAGGNANGAFYLVPTGCQEAVSSCGLVVRKREIQTRKNNTAQIDREIKDLESQKSTLQAKIDREEEKEDGCVNCDLVEAMKPSKGQLIAGAGTALGLGVLGYLGQRSDNRSYNSYVNYCLTVGQLGCSAPGRGGSGLSYLAAGLLGGALGGGGIYGGIYGGLGGMGGYPYGMGGLGGLYGGIYGGLGGYNPYAYMMNPYGSLYGNIGLGGNPYGYGINPYAGLYAHAGLGLPYGGYGMNPYGAGLYGQMGLGWPNAGINGGIYGGLGGYPYGMGGLGGLYGQGGYNPYGMNPFGGGGNGSGYFNPYMNQAYLAQLQQQQLAQEQYRARMQYEYQMYMQQQMVRQQRIAQAGQDVGIAGQGLNEAYTRYQYAMYNYQSAAYSGTGYGYGTGGGGYYYGGGGYGSRPGIYGNFGIGVGINAGVGAGMSMGN